MDVFQTAPILLEPSLVDLFIEHFDGNPVHLPGHSNEVMPSGTVPGLAVISLCSKALLQVQEFREVLCAKSFEIKFISPVFRGQSIRAEGSYQDSPHRSRKNMIHRVSECSVRCLESNEIVMRYQIVQLIRSR